MNNLFYTSGSFFMDFSVIIFSSLFTFSIFTFLFDVFKFSDIKLIRILQEISIIFILFSLFISIMLIYNINIIYVLDCSDSTAYKIINDAAINNKNISLGATLILEIDSFKFLAEVFKSAASNFGLGFCAGILIAGAGPAIIESSLPGIAKAVLILGLGVFGILLILLSNYINQLFLV